MSPAFKIAIIKSMDELEDQHYLIAVHAAHAAGFCNMIPE
jgi:hypothetical protein